MLRLDEPPRKPRPESVVPMINVVFLLLIFFLMTAQIAPPEPFEVEPPTAASNAPAETGLVLHLDADGRLAFRDADGAEAAVAALAEARRDICGACEGEDAAPVLLRADAGVAASEVAALLPRLGAAGIGAAELVTVTP